LQKEAKATPLMAAGEAGVMIEKELIERDSKLCLFKRIRYTRIFITLRNGKIFSRKFASVYAMESERVIFDAI